MEIFSEILMAFVFALLANLPTILGMKKLKLLLTSTMFAMFAVLHYVAGASSNPIISVGPICVYYIFDSAIDYWLINLRKKMSLVEKPIKKN